jgi:hypothetical protein
MKTERWKIALHESGHAVSAIVRGGRCDGVALLDDDSGLCQTGELLGNRDAYCIAAGPAAERLAEEYPAPDCTPPESRTLTVDEIEQLPLFDTARLVACQMAKTADTRRKFSSDDRLLAEWAISGNESDPESWAGRVAYAHEMAAEIVRHNAATIARIAEQLFVRGSLAESEVKTLFEGKPE